MSDGPGVRAFLALELESAVRQAVGDLQRQLRPRLGSLRLTRPEGVHLTLRFLGETSPRAIEAMFPPLERAAAACPPAEARVGGLGMFPQRGSPRVLWLGIEVPPSVLELQAACERAAVAAGLPAEPRAFRAHVTLGRWRERAPRPELPPADLGPARLDTLVFFRSDLRPGGAVYEALARFPLGGAGRSAARAELD